MEKIVNYLGGAERTILLCSLACLGAVLLLFCYKLLRSVYRLCSSIRAKRAQRRERRAERGRRLAFALPEQENAYVRARLSSSLRVEEGKDLDKDERSVRVRLGYARKMLSLVKEAHLSPVERLDVEEMSGIIALYGEKERWSNAEVKAINELFSRLIKLSAKYEIAV